MSLSGLCIVHCLMMPVVMAALPLWSVSETLHDWLHPLFLIGVVPISVVALVSTRGKPQLKSVRVLLGVGLFVITLATTIGHGAVNPLVETTFILLGSSLLVVGHWRNQRACRRCAH
jgi:peptidoglycan/LPS O-acetylase OafA/YrhL